MKRKAEQLLMNVKATEIENKQPMSSEDDNKFKATPANRFKLKSS